MEELRKEEIIKALLKKIKDKIKKISQPVKIMEVCGTHTMTVHKFGLRNMLFDSGVEMLSGPGCPVCVTPNEINEAAIDLLSRRKNLILTTFGDMTRVPTNKGSLMTAVPAKNSAKRIVYSPEEALILAKENRDKEVVFFGVGFETTIPSIAFIAKKAKEEKITNFSILSALWLIPPPLKVIVQSREVNISGFLYPGHVSTIIGQKPYQFIAQEYKIPGAITGFEPTDIMLGINSILDQILENKPQVSIEYKRAVNPEGNPRAQALMAEVLEEKDAHWRGLGLIPNSGLKLKKEFSNYDAEIKFNLSIESQNRDLPGCKCGEVLRGLILPPQCPLFGKICRPQSPQGPCMVSFEGACLAYYRYSLKFKRMDDGR
ncbi:MAG: hydrogenase formation protein HypD [Candidatus Aminicenantia bacterium]